MISLLIGLIVLIAVVYCLTLLPLPEPFRTIIWVIVAVAIIIWLLEGLSGSGHFHALW